MQYAQRVRHADENAQAAQNSRAQIQRLADRISNIFVPIVIAIAAATAAWWFFAPDQARAVSPENAGFDLILDPVGRWSESVRALRPGGRLVALGANAAQTAPMDVRGFYFGQFDLLGTTMGSSKDFAALLNMIDRCSVRAPVIDREFPLDRAADAHEHLERGRIFGKCVLTHD